MTKTIEIGVLGCGTAAKHHISALKSISNINIIWFCDVNKDRAKTAMKQWGKSVKIGANFDDLLLNDAPDVVHICTPPSTHSGLTVKALGSGCHILLEKPMATSNEEANRIIEARDKSGKKVCIMHNHMFDPPIIKAQKIIAKGVLGRLIYGEGRYFLDKKKMEMESTNKPDHWAYKLGSGIAGEYMPHPIYLLQSFFGPCYRLQFQKMALGSADNNPHLQYGYAAQLQFKDALGRILMIDNMGYDHFSIDIYGTRGALHINMMDLTYSIERQRSGLPLVLARMGVTVEQSIQRLLRTFSNLFLIGTGRLKRRPGHKLLIKTFYHAIRNNMDIPVPAEDGVVQVNTMEKLNDSIASIENK